MMVNRVSGSVWARSLNWWNCMSSSLAPQFTVRDSHHKGALPFQRVTFSSGSGSWAGTLDGVGVSRSEGCRVGYLMPPSLGVLKLAGLLLAWLQDLADWLWQPCPELGECILWEGSGMKKKGNKGPLVVESWWLSLGSI